MLILMDRTHSLEKHDIWWENSMYFSEGSKNQGWLKNAISRCVGRAYHVSWADASYLINTFLNYSFNEYWNFSVNQDLSSRLYFYAAEQNAYILICVGFKTITCCLAIVILNKTMGLFHFLRKTSKLQKIATLCLYDF